MKIISIIPSFSICLFLLISCTKSAGEEVPACEDNGTTKVTFTNTSGVSLKLEVAQTFNSSYVPNSPVIQMQLAPGATITKEFPYGKYFIELENGCPAACSQRSFYAKTYEQCSVYEENLK